jgi:glucose-1-phosphate adenylyltransferase
MDQVLGLILGGGRGTRLYPLTKTRSEPAVPIAGKYRLIDIPISNCLNSGLCRVYVLTQFQSVSLHRHIGNTYKFSPFGRGFVEVLAAQQTNETADWYRGTADAIRQNIRYVHDDGARDVLVLSGDQLYRLDFRRLLDVHRASGAAVTMAVVPASAEQARALGVVRLGEGDRITEFAEKPQDPAVLDALRLPAGWLAARGLEVGRREYLANMGIYLFTRQALFDLLQAPGAPDLVHDVFPRCLASLRFQAFVFDGYWEDLGTVKSYHEANLALAGPNPPFDFHTPEGIVYTHMRNLPAARVSAARLDDCLVSDGCVVAPGAKLERCVVGVRGWVGPGVTVRDTVVLGASSIETDAHRAQNRHRGVPDLGLGEGSVIERAILDKDCRIGRGVRLVNRRGVRTADGSNYVIRDGIIVIPSRTVVPDGTEI